MRIIHSPVAFDNQEGCGHVVNDNNLYSLLKMSEHIPPVLYPWDHGYSQWLLGATPTTPGVPPGTYTQASNPVAAASPPNIPLWIGAGVVFLLVVVLLLAIV